MRDTLKNRRYNNISTGETGQLLNYYASAINIPSKQLTTGQVSNIGVPYKYATGQAFSQININLFTVPRNHTTRTLFERWVQAISGDGDQYVDYYEDYICDELNIYKYEIGDGPEVRKTFYRETCDIFLGENKSTQKKNRDKMRVPKLMAVYQLRNIFQLILGLVS